MKQTMFSNKLLHFAILKFNLFVFSQTVYFQINVATNGTATYVSFVYQDGEMLWRTSTRRPRVGYTIQTADGRKEKFELILNGGGTLRAYKFDEVIGNTNAKGRWSWKLGGNFSKSGMK